ncbi:hypothetical protein mru_0937 [Methanobrevibacter ruminantium M1]|uniref:ArnR1-like winged helix-turn-helix domain-containing protein n=2 Tax=Methanobrevibacter ruminantium TaxID=83816 RepID=D3E2M7_METRM|nr:hypothetical protein mru_0937 [Methanobrevibacter ruminantium M1]
MKAVSYIKRSNNRYVLVMNMNGKFKMPSEIASEMDLRINQISAVLSDLKKEDIVTCINEEEKVGRLYKLTDKGLEAYKVIKTNEEIQ